MQRRSFSQNQQSQAEKQRPGPEPVTSAGAPGTGRPGQGVQRVQPQLPPQAMIPQPSQSQINPSMSMDQAAHAAQTISQGATSGNEPFSGAEGGMSQDPLTMLLKKMKGGGPQMGGY